ncbi:NirD/YgiW/YdeI family stress tolerance protein [Herbaspirillum camelliae]|uniref:NirD/YgiW/YdeI family stress tolerance protein n=1 Tax=Herbaspirillum camelliae TaxID=1892903 RepID=UPI000949F8DF|nr:NirD/YgiW/YdeI family stress tolerance protein [Herbaspirillum camelliae]
MRTLILASLLTCVVMSANAQYAGPGATPSVITAKELSANAKDDQRVVIRGYLIQQLGDETYRFRDETGEVLVKIDKKHWPAGVSVNEKTVVELTGKYDKEMVGDSKLEVRSFKVLQ